VGINTEIEAGAKAIADDLVLPDGGQKKLARVVEGQLAWFDAAEARGMTWAGIARVLFATGAKGQNGRPFSVGTLSSTVWRKREDAERNADSGASPSNLRIQGSAQEPRTQKQRSDHHEEPCKPRQRQQSTLRRPEHRSKTGEKRNVKASRDQLLPTKPVTALPKGSSNKDLLAFMRRSAAVRGMKSSK
jgi:hypothetical protein